MTLVYVRTWGAHKRVLDGRCISCVSLYARGASVWAEGPDKFDWLRTSVARSQRLVGRVASCWDARGEPASQFSRRSVGVPATTL